MASRDPQDGLREALDELARYPGVEFVVLLGRDGLLVEKAGGTVDKAEALAASVPAVAAACDTVGAQLELGDSGTIVAQIQAHSVIVQRVADDLWLAVLVQPGVNFSLLLAELRSQSTGFSDLI